MRIGEANLARVNDTGRAVRQAQLQGPIGVKPGEGARQRLLAGLSNLKRCPGRVRSDEPSPDYRFKPEIAPTFEFEVELAGKSGGKGIPIRRGTSTDGSNNEKSQAVR